MNTRNLHFSNNFASLKTGKLDYLYLHRQELNYFVHSSKQKTREWDETFLHVAQACRTLNQRCRVQHVFPIATRV